MFIIAIMGLKQLYINYKHLQITGLFLTIVLVFFFSIISYLNLQEEKSKINILMKDGSIKELKD